MPENRQSDSTDPAADERARCVKIIRHHLTAHQRSAKLATLPLAIAGHEAAAAALEDVLERIEEP